MNRHLPRAIPAAAPLQAAIYARVSSDQQAERHTIDSQLSELNTRAAQDGHPVRDEMLFLDNGHSGASLIRPALERLRDLVALAAIDIVYIHAPDRLARSYAHQMLLLEEFAHAGTEVIFLNRPIGHTPEDNLLLQLQGMFAEYERTKLLERSRRGKRHLAKTGAVSVLSPAPLATAMSAVTPGAAWRATRSTRTRPRSCVRSSDGWGTSASPWPASADACSLPAFPARAARRTGAGR